MAPLKALNWKEVTAVFGGTFDPPHLGHLDATLGLLDHPGVARVLVLPAGTPPLKSNQTSAQHRLEMVKRTFEFEIIDQRIQLETLEIDQTERNPSEPSYTFLTLQILKQKYPQIAFVIGADQLDGLDRWNRFPDILDLCHWIVLERKPHGMDITRKAMNRLETSNLAQKATDQSNGWLVGRNKNTCLTIVPTPAEKLQSTDIRQEIARTGQVPANALGPQVEDYLKTNKLYGL